MKFEESHLGFYYSHPKYFLFFGKKDANFENLKNEYPDFCFKRLRQCHSDISIQVNSSTEDFEITGDALICSEKNIALAVNTADCIPVLILNSDYTEVAAVHSGWRGVANNITTKTLQKMKGQSFEIHIGPHILKESFEIKEDAKSEILKNILPETQSLYFQMKDSLHYHLDLGKVLRNKIESLSYLQLDFNFLNIDTFADQRFHSFRRDKDLSGRQLSFVALR